MIEPRLATGLWVDALLRRVQLEGASAFVLHKGDADRGDVVVKVASLDGRARGFVPSIDYDSGVRSFTDLALRGVGETERDIDEYIHRARDRDPDLWIIEIEDREGRHFLTEPVELNG